RELAQAVSGLDDRIEMEIAGLGAFFAFVREHRELYRIVREAEFVDEDAFFRYYRRLAEGYTAALSRAMTLGQVRKFDPQVLAYALMGMADFLGQRFVLWDDDLDDARVVAAAGEF